MALQFAFLDSPKDLTLKEQILRARALWVERRRSSRQASGGGIIAPLTSGLGERVAVSEERALGHLLRLRWLVKLADNRNYWIPCCCFHFSEELKIMGFIPQGNEGNELVFRIPCFCHSDEETGPLNLGISLCKVTLNPAGSQPWHLVISAVIAYHMPSPGNWWTWKWSTPEGTWGVELSVCGWEDKEARDSGEFCQVFCHHWDLAVSCPWTHPDSSSPTTLMGVIKVKSGLNNIIFKASFAIYNLTHQILAVCCQKSSCRSAGRVSLWTERTKS